MCACFGGVDYGLKRIGIAVSDPEGKLAGPFSVVAADGTFEVQAAAIVREVDGKFDVDEWVVGLPLNMDDSEGPQAKLTRRFAGVLEKISGLPVHLWDERLSSAQADIYLTEASLTRKKKKSRRDMLAAQVILQTFLDARPAEAPHDGDDTVADGDSA